ncbi:hypothetical protein QTP88_023329 [Uroleucon formosanum]
MPRHSKSKRPFLGPPLPAINVITQNIEGFSVAKGELLASLCKSQRCDVLCVQETHRDEASVRPKIPGMNLVIELPHPQYGSAIYTKPELVVESASYSHNNQIEILTIEVRNCTITSVYKPPKIAFDFVKPDNFDNCDTKIVLGDFNSHSVMWGYQETDQNGENVETWAEAESLFLVHDPKLPPSFNSGRWKKSYNPDLTFVSNKLAPQAIKNVCDPIPNTQHRGLTLSVTEVVRSQTVPFKRRFNFRKAKWKDFRENLDKEIRETPINHLCKDRNDRWHELIENTDMTKNSKKAWQLIKRLNGDPVTHTNDINVTANQVASQLLLNGKPGAKIKREKLTRIRDSEQNNFQLDFTLDELNESLKEMKNGKAPGVDEIMTEQIKEFSIKSKQWLLTFLNSCRDKALVPKMWRKAKVVALPKPGKDYKNPKNYRPISLLCHTFKLYERMIMNRIKRQIERKLIPEQAGFRPGKNCTGQVLNLCQHIEDGYENKKATGVVFVDLSAAYDTVNHNLLLKKIYECTSDWHLVQIISSMLHNRRFTVTLNNKWSRWRNQRNGLPQGSVLAPMLFNIYTNDQPIIKETKHFLYADDLALAAQDTTFEIVERKLTRSLQELTNYYTKNQLRPNPDKTQVCSFHLRNREAKRELKVEWLGKPLGNTEHPVYLGVTLDRTLTFKEQCKKTKMKVEARNNLIRKLAGSKWGATPNTIRTTGLALCFSAGEYACPVWNQSKHTKHVDTALNETCRVITGCLKPTPLKYLYPLAGIAPPEIRRHAATCIERTKQSMDQRHPMYGYSGPQRRLKSRRSFIANSTTIHVTPEQYRIQKWREEFQCEKPVPPAEHLPCGGNQPWIIWKTLNRLRTGVAKTKANMRKWGYQKESDILCECGEDQSDDHLLQCTLAPPGCTTDDLALANEKAISIATHWLKQNI